MTDLHYQKITTILTHLSHFSREFPGNIGEQNLSYCCPFPDEGTIIDDSDMMEKWFNERLFKRQRRGYDISFQNSDLVLCHRDLAPRNILWQDDGSVYLIDWITAGYYPISFEVCTQRCGNDVAFNTKLEEIICARHTIDMTQLQMIIRVWGNGQKYTL